MHFQERQQAHAAECSRVYPPDACGWPHVPTKGRSPFETEIQARFTPIRVLTQAVKTVAYLRVSTRAAGRSQPAPPTTDESRRS